VKVFIWLSATLRSQVRGQILGGDSILTLIATFSRVMRVSTGADVSFAPSMQSVMVSGRDRGRGRGRDFGGRGRGFVGGGRGSYGGRQSVSKKGPRLCRHCGRSNHISEKCWEKFGRIEWAQLSDSDPLAPRGTTQDSSSIFLALPRLFYHRKSMIDFDN